MGGPDDEGVSSGALVVTSKSHDSSRTTDEDVIRLANTAMKNARAELQRLPSSDMNPGITIDLGAKGINHLPDEVINAIKDDIERLALSHNRLSSFPVRLPECTRLRYLNVRWNHLREFPAPIAQLSWLEILDISNNSIRILPDSIANLTSLKVLAVSKNKIERLPLCLGDLNSLKSLKIDGNQIAFPPRDICTIKPDAPKPASENDRVLQITTQIKRYLRQVMNRQQLQVESEDEYSETNLETPRPPKRTPTGRFPVRPSVSGIEGITSRPASPSVHAPSIPTRSHLRNRSQANGSQGLPSSSFLLGSNERNRSQSESNSIMSLRTKRPLGAVKATTLEPLDEGSLRRSIHLRGQSDGSAVREKEESNEKARPPHSAAPSVAGFSTASAAITEQRKSTSSRRGHFHPSRDAIRHFRSKNTEFESLRAFFFTLEQMASPLDSIVHELRGRFPAVHAEFLGLVERLAHDLDVIRRRLDSAWDGEGNPSGQMHSPEFIGELRSLSIRAAVHAEMISRMLFANAPALIKYVWSRAMRMYFQILQLSVFEVRNALVEAGIQFGIPPRISRDSLTPTQQRPTNSISNPHMRQRDNLAEVPKLVKPTQRRGPMPPLQKSPAKFSFSSVSGRPQIAREYSEMHSSDSMSMPPPPVPLGGYPLSRTNTMSSMGSIGSATPRSGESFQSLALSLQGLSGQGLPATDELVIFEEIWSQLRCVCNGLFVSLDSMTEQANNIRTGAAQTVGRNRHTLLNTVNELAQEIQILQRCNSELWLYLERVKLKDPSIVTSTDFWGKAAKLLGAWYKHINHFRAAKREYGLRTDRRVMEIMLRVHDDQKTALDLISASPFFGLIPMTDLRFEAKPGPIKVTPKMKQIQHRREQERIQYELRENQRSMLQHGAERYSNNDTMSAVANVSAPEEEDYWENRRLDEERRMRDARENRKGYTSGDLVDTGTARQTYHEKAFLARREQSMRDPMPATPLSAALGPAAQATMPRNATQYPPAITLKAPKMNGRDNVH
ncbi:hypothetical protein K402DRAFT_392273 [Aulographum hederae CBS 113979]|uniref:Disease resistance R13L4/SHOC-2-like LRR domain-containing protein n=1 Tax=Aulographum hederae CBS 113979 TaxID=1176131 RepID=A0A6G1H4L1_9PEZI|nr:hypothetical protein K402DRAFT_392273 [Aulographum hederae CBS 113979]